MRVSDRQKDGLLDQDVDRGLGDVSYLGWNHPFSRLSGLCLVALDLDRHHRFSALSGDKTDPLAVLLWPDDGLRCDVPPRSGRDGGSSYFDRVDS